MHQAITTASSTKRPGPTEAELRVARREHARPRCRAPRRAAYGERRARRAVPRRWRVVVAEARELERGVDARHRGSLRIVGPVERTRRASLAPQHGGGTQAAPRCGPGRTQPRSRRAATPGCPPAARPRARPTPRPRRGRRRARPMPSVRRRCRGGRRTARRPRSTVDACQATVPLTWRRVKPRVLSSASSRRRRRTDGDESVRERHRREQGEHEGQHDRRRLHVAPCRRRPMAVGRARRTRTNPGCAVRCAGVPRRARLRRDPGRSATMIRFASNGGPTRRSPATVRSAPSPGAVLSEPE